MKIVVTGCKGRIGGTVLEYMRSQGAQVLGVDTVGIGNFVDYIHADMTDLAQVYDVLHGADAVIHLAAIRDPRLFTAVMRVNPGLLQCFELVPRLVTTWAAAVAAWARGEVGVVP